MAGRGGSDRPADAIIAAGGSTLLLRGLKPSLLRQHDLVMVLPARRIRLDVQHKVLPSHDGLQPAAVCHQHLMIPKRFECVEEPLNAQI